MIRNISWAMRVCVAVFFTTQVNALLAQVSGTIVHDGLERGYELHVPSTWSLGQSLPLVFVLHGTTQTGERIMEISNFNALAEANNFIVVYPDGIGGSWNTGIPLASTADDMGLIEALIARFQVDLGVDTLRIYSCGFSAGGYLSYRLACESSRCFAAVASVAGTMTQDASDACVPQHITPAMQIHGTSDFVVDYNGSAVAGISVDELIAQWNGFNNCPLSPDITQLPNIDLFDLSTVEQHVYAPCDATTSTVLLKVNGGGHQWPGTDVILGGLGTINRDISASEKIWEFFSGFSCQGISTVVVEAGEHPTVLYDPISQCLGFEWTGTPKDYEIIDGIGRIVDTGTFGNGCTTIPMVGMAQGIYTVRTSVASASAYCFYKD